MASLVLYLEDGTTQAVVLDPEQPVSLGRHADNALVLGCGSVSSHHGVLSLRADGWYVQDLGSSNGTRVNGAQVEEAALADGDRLSFGDIQAIFYLDDAVAASVALEESEISAVAEAVAEAQPVHEAYIPPPPRPATPPGKSKLLPAERLRTRTGGSVKNYPGEETSGCLNALGITAACVFAVVLGLFLRHAQERPGRNFLSDTFDAVFGEMPRITIQKKADSSKSD